MVILTYHTIYTYLAVYFGVQLDPLPLLLLCAALFTLHTHVWAVFRGATPPLAPLLLLLLLRVSHCICSLVLIQPAAAAVGPEYERCPESIDVQNPWNIRALERPEPTAVEDCLYLVDKKRERTTGKAWR